MRGVSTQIANRHGGGSPSLTASIRLTAVALSAAMIVLTPRSTKAPSTILEATERFDVALQTVQPAGPDPSTCLADWQHPVSAPIVDWFRPPANPYGPGNLGLEYGTAPGDPVTAVDDGVVGFVGPVGGSRFVVVEHRSGLKSTYGYLDTTVVGSGQSVAQGDQVATAATGFHLTARSGGDHIDPLRLLTDGCFAVRLVSMPDAAGLIDLWVEPVP